MQKESLRTKRFGGRYSRYFAGGFAMTLVRNETQRHSAALKRAGQSPIGLLPLNRCMTRFCVVSGLGELGFPPLSYHENRAVTK